MLGKYPHQLSGGQQQRLLIARALLLDVKLLVADEIISMLDASTRVDVLNLLVGLKRAGLAILFITHDLSLGNYISDRTVILRHGAIVETGPDGEGVRQPAALLHEDAPGRRAAAAQEVARARGRDGAAGARGRCGPGRVAAAPGERHAHRRRCTPGAVRPPAPTTRGQVRETVRPAGPPLTECEQGHLVAAEEQP